MRRLLLLLSGLLVACSSSSSDGTTTATSGNEPPATCAPGSMPAVDGTCAPVGPAECPDGFSRSSSGWGCEAIVPADACSGATRAVLGQTACAPVDDCSAAFPPAGATVVKSSAELTAALASARPGATIALDSGTYDAIEIRQSVNLVGRCAEKVVVKGTGDRGVWVQADVKVGLRSMSVTGFQGGLSVSYGPKVEASNLVLTGNTIGVVAGEAMVTLSDSVIEGVPATASTVPDNIGVTALQGGVVTAKGVDVRDTQTALAVYDPGSSVTVQRSVVRYVGPASKGDLMQAFRGGAIDIQESTVQSRERRLLYVGNELPGIPSKGAQRGGKVRFASSEIAQGGFSMTDGALLLVAEGGSVELDSATLHHEAGIAIILGERGAQASVTNSVIRGVPNGGDSRVALMALHGAAATFTGSAIVSSWQNALTAGDTATITLDHSLVADTKFGAPGPNAAMGGLAMAVGASGAGLVMTSSAITGSDQFGILVGEGGTLDMSASIVDATAMPESPDLPGGFGVAASGASVAIDGSIVRGSASAALFFQSAKGVVQTSRFIASKVGVELAGTTATHASAVRDANDGELLLVNDTFERTETETLVSDSIIPAF